MKIVPLALVAALGAAALTLPVSAEARDHGWHKRHHQQHCWTEWRHHHRVRRCR